MLTIDEVIEMTNAQWFFYSQRKFTEVEIDALLEQKKDLFCVYLHQKLTEKQIDKALDIGKNLNWLLQYQKLTERQVESFLSWIFKQEDEQERLANIHTLYCYQKLTEKQIDKALKEKVCLNSLYFGQVLNSKQIEHVVYDTNNNDIDIIALCCYQRLTDEQKDFLSFTTRSFFP